MVRAKSNTDGQQPLLLLVDDDRELCSALRSAMKKRGFEVTVAHDAGSALELATPRVPQFAIVDLNLNGSSGLVLVENLVRLSKGMRILVLTGFATTDTAVQAVKYGAHDYLIKPANADDIAAALCHEAKDLPPPPAKDASADDLEWEHLRKVLIETNGNVSEAARLLGVHRRTVQRKLSRRPAEK